MVLGLEDPDALPRLSTPTFCCVIALIAVIWVWLRVRLAKGQIAKAGAPTTRLGFIRKLAVRPRIDWELGGAALILAGAALLLR